MRTLSNDSESPPRPAPLLPPAIGLIAGITCSEFSPGLPSFVSWMVCGAALNALFASRFARRSGAASMIRITSLALLAAGIGIARHQSVTIRPSDDIANFLTSDAILTRIRGEVIDPPASQPPFKANPFMHFDPPCHTRFRLRAAELLHNGPPQPISGDIRIVVNAQSLDLHPGDRVELTGLLYLPRPPQNPGETDWAAWHRLNRYSADMSIESAPHVLLLERDPQSGQKLLNAWRAWARALLIEPVAASDESESLRLLDAIVLGQRSAVDQQLNEAFFRTGSIHILSVSGFHIGALAGCSWFVLRRILRRGIRSTAIVTCATVVLYAALTELDAPVVRSTIMGLLGCLAILFRRPFSVLNWLALSAGIVLLIHPLDLFTPGFQLSFVQILALFTIVPTIYRGLLRRRDPDLEPRREAQTFLGWLLLWGGHSIVGLAIVSLTTWLVSLPLVMFHFGQIAAWSPLQSMLLTPFFTLVIVLGFITLLVSAINAPAGSVLAHALETVTSWLIHAVESLARLPGTLREINPPPLWIVLLSYGLLIVTVALWPPQASPLETESAARRRRKRLFSALAPLPFIAILWVGWIVWPPARCPDYTLHILAVGNGSCAALVNPTGEAAIIDVGTSANFDAGQTAAHALRALHVQRLNTLAISHADIDHYGGVPRLLASYAADRLLATPQFLASDSPAVARFRAELPKNAHFSDLHAPATLSLLGQPADVLWPPANPPEKWSDNDTSLVLRIRIRNQTVLIPGDIERNAMRALLDAQKRGEIDLHADILIAPHHGSIAGRETTDFYAAVAPKLVIISSVKPRPKIETLIRSTLGPDAQILTTGVSGAVTIRFRDPLVITTWNPAHP